MKKLTLFFMALLIFNVSFASEKIDTTFTFQGYSPTSKSFVRDIKKAKLLNKSRVSYPMFTGRNANVVKNMNKSMERFISKYKSTKHVSYNVSYEITANNSSVLSVLFTVELVDNDSGQKTKLHNGITYNLKSGKQLQLKDMFVSGFENSLIEVINKRFDQFGLPQVDRFSALAKRQDFYMENDAIVFIYNKGEASNFADGEVYVPFIITDFYGILQ